MFTSSQEVVSILGYYKYLVIFPIAVIEGPIIIVISGFLVFLKILNGPLTYVVLVVADTIGDSLYYTIGRYFRSSSWARKYAKFLGYDEGKEAFLEEHFKNHKGKTFILAKISHGLGGTVQIASGIARVNFIDFIFYSLIGTVPKTLVFLLIGYYAGQSYIRIDEYFDSVALITVSFVVLLILSYVLFGKYAKRLLAKMD